MAAELIGTGVQTLRLYERRGLLAPSRTSGGTRRYSEDDLERLRRIGQLIDDGVNLAGIAKVLHLEGNNAGLEFENVSLRADNATLQGDNARLQTHNATLETGNAALHTDNAALRTDNAALRTDNAALRTDNANLTAGNAGRKVTERRATSPRATRPPS